MIDFAEVADRVWVARYPGFDVNVGLVAGSAGLAVIDTNASAALGRDTLDAVRRISAAPVLAAINTHAHFDHVLGSGIFRDAGAAVIAHERTAAALDEGAPDRTFSSALALDLGDRTLELIHPGRGHTDGDIVVRVPDADVVFAGDLVEESAVPSFGPDCFPMEWPTSLDLMLTLTTPGTRVVPGHGAVVDQDFVYAQRAAIGVIAETLRDLVTRGVPVDQALETGDWPYPRENLADAVRRGYEQLPRVRRQLPLL